MMTFHVSLDSPGCPSIHPPARFPESLISIPPSQPRAQVSGPQLSLTKPNVPSFLGGSPHTHNYKAFQTHASPFQRAAFVMSCFLNWKQVLFTIFISFLFFQNENQVITVVGHLESVPAFILHRLLNNTKIAHSTSHWVMKSLTFLG